MPTCSVALPPFGRRSRSSATGDLEVRLARERDDDIGAVIGNLNETVGSLRQIVGRIHSTASQVRAAAQGIFDVSKRITGGAGEQQRGADDASQRLAKMVASIADMVQATAGLAADVNATAASIHEIGEQSNLVAARAAGLKQTVDGVNRSINYDRRGRQGDSKQHRAGATPLAGG